MPAQSIRDSHNHTHSGLQSICSVVSRADSVSDFSGFVHIAVKKIILIIYIF